MFLYGSSFFAFKLYCLTIYCLVVKKMADREYNRLRKIFS